MVELSGASVVEIDVQLTGDHRAVVYHDDFLPDLTCLHRLTLDELRRRVPHVPTLREVLREAAEFNDHSGLLRGLLIVEHARRNRESRGCHFRGDTVS